MAKSQSRKSISPKARFEVFKRDAFTCQYCGSKAPDVVLHVDHIHPVASGGGNDIMNLVTSCFDCNSGKGKRKLSDNSVLKKQRVQIDELNERRNQLDLMVQWRKEVADMKEQEASIIEAEIPMEKCHELTENGRATVIKWLKKYSVQKVLEAVDISFGQYLRYDKNGKIIEETWQQSFNMVQRILDIRNKAGYTEDVSKINYICAVLANRGLCRNKWVYRKELEYALSIKIDFDELKEFSKYCENLDEFNELLENLVVEREYEIKDGGLA